MRLCQRKVRGGKSKFINFLSQLKKEVKRKHQHRSEVSYNMELEIVGGERREKDMGKTIKVKG